MRPLVYDLSAWELSGAFASGGAWTFEQLRGELDRRVEAEKGYRRLHVNYYRIGQVLSFDLPLTRRPVAFPTAWPDFDRYPWQTWLAWRLEERWNILHAGWRRGDVEAGRLFQEELAALSQWESFTEPLMGVNLVTGHLAACLALGLADEESWEPDWYQQAKQAAQALLERDVHPWAREHWGGDAPFTARQIHNIPTISLVRSAQLAAILQHPDTAVLNKWACKALRTWGTLRAEAHHTEGFAYDGYLMDHMTAWLAGRADRDGLVEEASSAWQSLRDQWVHCVPPGRADLQAPVGDVEPEMPFWMTALLRLARWRGWKDAFWLLRRCPPERMPATMLVEAVNHEADWPVTEAAPQGRAMDLVSAVSLRSGWNREDRLVTIGCPRTESGHLHADGGHVIIARAGRFWITDPGYQQYRPGLERQYTIGPLAHNGPVVNGQVQTRKAARLLELTTHTDGRQTAELDLSACYESLPQGASMRRAVWLEINGEVVVEDRFDGLDPSTPIAWHWHGGTQLAWAFAEGRARLDDGERALWIATSAGPIEPGQVSRIEGSRGPLTLVDERASVGESWRCRWRFAWE